MLDALHGRMWKRALEQRSPRKDTLLMVENPRNEDGERGARVASETLWRVLCELAFHQCEYSLSPNSHPALYLLYV